MEITLYDYYGNSPCCQYRKEEENLADSCSLSWHQMIKRVTVVVIGSIDIMKEPMELNREVVKTGEGYTGLFRFN